MTRWSAAPTGWSGCRRTPRSTPWRTGSSPSLVLVVCVYGFRFMLFVNKIAVAAATVLFLPRHLRLRRRLRPVVRRGVHAAGGRGHQRAVLAVVHRRRPDRPVQPGVLRRVPRRLVALHPGRHAPPQGHGRGLPGSDRDDRAVRLRPGDRLDHRRQGPELPRRRGAQLRRRAARGLPRVVLPAGVPDRADRRHVDRHDLALRHRAGLLQRVPAVQPGPGDAVHRRRPSRSSSSAGSRSTWCRASRPSRC